MDIFKTKLLNNRQRWNRAILFGILATGLSIIVGSSIQRFLHLNTTLVHIAAGFFIGWVIREAGHGVQSKFVYLAAGCTIVAIILIDIFTLGGLSVLVDPFSILLLFKLVLTSYLSISVNGLLSLVLKITAIVISMQTARIA